MEVPGVRLLFTEAEIAARIEELASEIAAELPETFTLVGLLKGSFILVADLARALSRQGLAPRIEFFRLASYGDARESSGRVSLVGAPPGGLAGRKVLLVDDILDTGRTLQTAVGLLKEAGAAEVRTCVLLDKPARRALPVQADFVGFEVPDRFVVGYGIDAADTHRELPFIGTVD